MPDECLQGRWPDVTNCAEWNIRIDEGIRILKSNSIPPYYVPPYCPFGIDEGYCQSPTQGDSADCDVFRNMKCPCKEQKSPIGISSISGQSNKKRQVIAYTND